MSQHYRQRRPYKRPPRHHSSHSRPSNHHYKHPYRKPRQAGPQEIAFVCGLVLVGLLAWSFQNVDSDQAARQVLALIAAVVLIAATGFAFYMMRMHQKRRALRALKWANVDVMDGFTFEQYVGAVMKSLGYEVQFTAQSGDFGVDILARKDGERIAVQIKRSRNFIGLAAVQEVVAGMYHYKCDRSMVVTNSTFSEAAKTLAASNNCQLIDRALFGQWIVAFQRGGIRK